MTIHGKKVVQKNEYKIVLILKYLSKIGENYSYSEMMDMFGFSFLQLQDTFEDLEKKGLIIFESYYEITDSGRHLIDSYNLLNDSQIDSDEDIFTEVPLKFKDIYIPEKFDKKFKLD